MSKHNAEFIMKHLAYAAGLQFRALFWESKGIELDSGLEKASLETIIE